MPTVCVAKLKQAMQFEQTELPAGTELAVISIEQDAVRLSQLLSLIQYGHVEVDVLEIEVDEDELPTPSLADVVSHDGESGSGDGSNSGDHSGDEDGDGDNTDGDQSGGEESQELGSLARAGFDESLIDALAANEITELDQLIAFVDAGKDLVDLDRIGKVRAEKILSLLDAARAQ